MSKKKKNEQIEAVFKLLAANRLKLEQQISMLHDALDESDKAIANHFNMLSDNEVHSDREGSLNNIHMFCEYVCQGIVPPASVLTGLFDRFFLYHSNPGTTLDRAFNLKKKQGGFGSPVVKDNANRERKFALEIVRSILQESKDENKEMNLLRACEEAIKVCGFKIEPRYLYEEASRSGILKTIT